MLAPLGLKLTIMGSPPSIAEPFKDVQVAPGETPFNFLDRLARQRGLYLGDDEGGNLLALAGVQGAGGGLVEGQNIKALRAVFRDDFQFSKVVAIGQRNGDDKEWGKNVSQIVAAVENPNATRYLPFKFFAERPVTKRDLEIRANYEAQFNLAMSIEVTVVVCGWLRSAGGVSGRPAHPSAGPRRLCPAWSWVR